MNSTILACFLLTASLSAAYAADAMIVMKNFDFSPMDLTVAPGTP